MALKNLSVQAQVHIDKWYEIGDTVAEQGRSGPITWKFIHDKLDSTRWRIGVSFYIDKGYRVYSVKQPGIVTGQPTLLFICYPGADRTVKFFLENPVVIHGDKNVTTNEWLYGNNKYTDSCRFEYIFTCSAYLAKKAYIGLIFQYIDSEKGIYYPYKEWYYKLIPIP